MVKSGSVTKASVILMIGAIFSKLLAFARELFVAYRFGAGSISDAFILTNGIPTILFVSLVTAININFIPFFHRIETQESRDCFTSNVMNICLIIMLGGCLVVNIFPELFLKLFATGLPPETEKYSVLMLRIVVFSIIPLILSYLFQAYLQANKLFSSTAFYGVITNTVVILTTFLATEENYYILSIGTVTSYFVGLFFIFFYLKNNTSFHYTFYFNPRDKNIKMFILLTMPLLAEDIASSMSLLADRNIASFLDKGTISGLSYAGAMGQIASTMIAASIITASFPTFSQLIAEKQQSKFMVLFERYANIISYLLAPISAFLLVNAQDIVTLIFEHGAFSSSSSKIVIESMICYTVGLLPMGLQSYFIRGFYVMQDTQTPVKIKVFSFAVGIGLKLITVKYLAHMGIALSTSLSFIMSYILLMYFLKSKHAMNNLGNITREGLFALFLSLGAAVSCYLIVNHLFFVKYVLVRLLMNSLFFAIIFLFLGIILRKEQFMNLLLTIRE